MAFRWLQQEVARGLPRIFGGTLSALGAEGSGQSWTSWPRANPRRHIKSVAPLPGLRLELSSSPEFEGKLRISRSTVEQRYSGRRESSGWPEGTWHGVRGRSFQSAAVLHAEGTHGRPPVGSDTHALGAVDPDEAVSSLSGGRRRTLFLSTKTGPLEEGRVCLERFQREVAAIPGTPPLRRDDTADIVTLAQKSGDRQSYMDDVVAVANAGHAARLGVPPDSRCRSGGFGLDRLHRWC